LGALAAGAPLVVCPLFADQSLNGRMVDRAGAGIVVESCEAGHGGLRLLGPEDAPALQAAIRRVSDDPRYRQAAQRIATEIAATPSLCATLALVLRAD
jgi:UDP:flavonoid glycosyltransferase YjiC (YdhE family)